MPKPVNINLNNFRHLIHPLVTPEHFSDNKVKAIYLPPGNDAMVLTENPNKIIKDVFPKQKHEVLPINDFMHSIVDSYAISKGLPPNVIATHFFRIHFSVYSMSAIVTRSNTYIWIFKCLRKKRWFKPFRFDRRDLQSNQTAECAQKHIQKNAITCRKAMKNQC